MNKTRYTLFNKIEIDTAFSPAFGEIGANKVYLKTINGICPQIGTKAEFGIFHPEDHVVIVNVPAHILKKHLE